MKQTKKVVALLLCLAMCLSLAACGSSGSSGESSSEDATESTSEVVDSGKEGDPADISTTGTILDNGRLEKITIGMNADPQEFSPWNPNQAGKNLVWHQVYECLFDNDGSDYVPVLAKGYEAVDDVTYDVEIYDYIQDSAGNPITADDVVYSYNVLVDSGYGLKYDIFESIEKIDDYTVRFHFTEDPMVSIGALEFIWGGTAIFSEKAYEEGNFATTPVATGPYTVADYQSGSSVKLEANDNYWQTDESLVLDTHKRNVQTIEYDIIAEASSQTVALTTDSIQYSDYFDTSSISDFEEGGKYAADFTVNYQDSNTVYFLMPNCAETQITSDENLRKAIFYALDNQQICDAVTGFNVAYDMGTNIFADYDPKWESEKNYITEYDPELAQEYLDKSSYNGETLTFITSNEEDFKNMATIITALLSQVGIATNLETLDSSTYQTTTYENDAWDLALGFCASGGFCVSLSQVIFDNTINDDGLTLNNVDDPELQSQYEICNTLEGNNTEELDKLREIWIDNAYVDPIAVPTNITIYNKVLQDVCYDNNLNYVPGGSTYAGQ